MPYNPSTGVYSLPAVYLAIPGTTIVAVQHNTPLTDLQTAQNYERPIIAGGTGAGTAAQARTNLGVTSAATTVTYSGTSVDNVVPRWNGVAGVLQDSALTIADNGDSVQEATDAGAAAGPVDDLYRNSASPAANDIIGSRQWTGEDSAGNKEVYAEARAVILDPTSGSEDAKIVRRTVVAGTLADRMHTGAGTWMEGATGGDPGVGKINATEVQMNGSPLDLRLGTSVTPPAATTFDFTTPIGANTKQVTVSFSGLSLASSGVMILQMGDAGGIETSGYDGVSVVAGGGSSDGDNWTSGIILEVDNNASNVLHGSVILTLIDSATNLWAISGTSGRSSAGFGNYMGGSKALSAALTTIRFTTVAGTALFDNSGKANIAVQNG